MVKVVRKGNKNLTDCDDCGSLLKYSAGDVKRTYHSPRGYDLEGHHTYSIRCPPCGSKIDVTSEISSGLIRKIEKREKSRDLFE